MAYLRYNIQLAIPLDNKGDPPQGTKADIVTLEECVRRLRGKAQVINKGLPNEEDTVVANRHICHHDEPNNKIPCVPVEI